MNDHSITGPLRPPSEAHSLLVRVTRNCPWNRCAFCPVFKGRKFAIRTAEEVKGDIHLAGRSLEEVKRWSEQSGLGPGLVARYNGILWIDDGGVKRVFLQDSDSLIMETAALVEILESIRGVFPTVERITSYARGKTIFKKKWEELRRLRQAGLSRLHVGLETGDDELLRDVKKGATAEQMVEAGRRAIEAGIEVSEYIMPGLGGSERWEPHAVNSASVLNRINPDFIRLRTLHLVAGTPMFEKARRGEFQVQTIVGLLEEIRRFVEELDVTSELVTGDHAFNYFLGEVDGKLPGDKDRLLKSVDEALERWRACGEPKRNPFLGGLL